MLFHILENEKKLNRKTQGLYGIEMHYKVICETLGRVFQYTHNSDEIHAEL